jgi:hypothetical protein
MQYTNYSVSREVNVGPFKAISVPHICVFSVRETFTAGTGSGGRSVASGTGTLYYSDNPDWLQRLVPAGVPCQAKIAELEQEESRLKNGTYQKTHQTCWRASSADVYGTLINRRINGQSVYKCECKLGEVRPSPPLNCPSSSEECITRDDPAEQLEQVKRSATCGYSNLFAAVYSGIGFFFALFYCLVSNHRVATSQSLVCKGLRFLHSVAIQGKAICYILCFMFCIVTTWTILTLNLDVERDADV